MKKTIFTSMCVIAIIIQSIYAQDQADGFASVPGNGLLTTTGGEGGTTVIVSTLTELQTYANSTDPYIIIVKGILEPAEWTQISVLSNKTIVGYGNDATLKNVELNLSNVENVIIRNLTIKDSYVEGDYDGKENDNDGIQLDNCHHIWIDHCIISHCGDGLIDSRSGTNYITVSWTQLSNHNKAFGIGWTDETSWVMTIHHCWFDNTNQRNPSFDQGIGHLYNNYLSNVTSYGNLARGAARVIVQNSSFYKVNSPLAANDAAALYASGNIFQSCSGNKVGNTTTLPYNPRSFYDYNLDDASDVKTIVMSGSGPHEYIGNQYLDSTSTNYFSISVAEGNGSLEADTNNYAPGQYVTITATPEYGWELDRWNIGQYENTSPLTIVASDSVNLMAYFTLAEYKITTTVSEGEGSISPTTSNFEFEEDVVITASPEEGWVFDHWEGDLTGNKNPDTITISEDMDIYAYFVQNTTNISSEKLTDKNITYTYNPVNRTLRFQTNEIQEVNLDIYTIGGKKVFSNQYKNLGETDVLLYGIITKGVYIIRFESKGQVQSARIVQF